MRIETISTSNTPSSVLLAERGKVVGNFPDEVKYIYVKEHDMLLERTSLRIGVRGKGKGTLFIHSTRCPHSVHTNGLKANFTDSLARIVRESLFPPLKKGKEAR